MVLTLSSQFTSLDVSHVSAYPALDSFKGELIGCTVTLESCYMYTGVVLHDIDFGVVSSSSLYSGSMRLCTNSGFDVGETTRVKKSDTLACLDSGLKKSRMFRSHHVSALKPQKTCKRMAARTR